MIRLVVIVLAVVALAALTGCAAGGAAQAWRVVERVYSETAPSETAPRVVAERITERATVTQPSRPAGPATIDLGEGRIGAAAPASHRPAAPASPVSVAMGWLVWVCGGAALLGVVLIVGRLAGLGWLSAVMPVGLGWGLAIGGSLGVAALTVLDRWPWLPLVALGVGVGAAVVVGGWDNLRRWWSGGQP